MSRLATVCILALTGPALFAPATRAASVDIGASKDNTLYAEFDTLSNGAGQRFFAGRNGPGNVRRGLVHFDIAGVVPAGATIDSVVIRLVLAQTGPGTRTIAVHRVLAAWGEGASVGSMGEGGGAPATAGDATWGQRFFGAAQPWTTPGGDYHPAASASRPVGVVGNYAWRSAGLAADVAAWLSTPASNFGWELVGDETAAGTAKAFSSRQASTASARPMLTVYYTESTTGTGPLPATAQLFPVHPNPFNPSATLRYHVPAPVRVELAVYDVSGRLIRVLANGVATTGTHEVVWRGDDTHGRRIASGVYLARFRAGNAPARVEKMVLLK